MSVMAIFVVRNHCKRLCKNQFKKRLKTVIKSCQSFFLFCRFVSSQDTFYLVPIQGDFMPMMALLVVRDHCKRPHKIPFFQGIDSKPQLNLMKYVILFSRHVKNKSHIICYWLSVFLMAIYVFIKHSERTFENPLFSRK